MQAKEKNNYKAHLDEVVGAKSKKRKKNKLYYFNTQFHACKMIL
jgi:hypothetical protein